MHLLDFCHRFDLSVLLFRSEIKYIKREKEMEWWFIPLTILSLAFLIIAVRIAVSFDINKWMESKRAVQEEKLKNICPHVYISSPNGRKIRLISHFHSPSGTIAYVCNQCGFITWDSSVPDMLLMQWGQNPSELIKQQKKFIRLARRMRKI